MSAQEDTSSIEARLRFIVISDEPRLYQWEADSIREAVASGSGALSGIIFTRGYSSNPTPADGPSRYSAFAARSSGALNDTGFDASTAEAPILDYASYNGGDFGAEASGFVSTINPDFLLMLGRSDSDVALRLATLARWGVWSHRFGEAHSPLSQSAVLKAVASGCYTVSAFLVMRTNKERLLHAGTVGTFLARPAKTVDHLCSSITPWLRRACVDIAKNGFSESRFPEIEAIPPQLSGASNVTIDRVLSGMAKGFVKTQALYRLSRQQWNVGVIHAPISTVAGLNGAAAQALALDSVQWMPEESGVYFADPFGYELPSGEIRMLFEVFDWASGRGTIAMRNYDGRHFDDIRTILDAQTHLSYPFLVSLNGEPHYIPEHAEACDVSAFAINEGGQTIRTKTLLPRVELLDCTFVEWDDKIWMFALVDQPAKNTQLHLFYSDRIDGVWQAHPLNPIKTDVGSARPGGTPFVHNGRLYRPSQDCSTHYGRGTVICEILSLSATDYTERQVSRIDPPAGWRYSFGLHTVSQVNNITLIDGARKVGRWSR